MGLSFQVCCKFLSESFSPPEITLSYVWKNSCCKEHSTLKTSDKKRWCWFFFSCMIPCLHDTIENPEFAFPTLAGAPCNPFPEVPAPAAVLFGWVTHFGCPVGGCWWVPGQSLKKGDISILYFSDILIYIVYMFYIIYIFIIYIYCIDPYALLIYIYYLIWAGSTLLILGVSHSKTDWTLWFV